jgi:putative endonuclease
MEPRSFYVYILASGIGGTLYIGVTNDLVRRVGEHKLKITKGFTKKYGVHKLVYYEQFDDAENAIRREKQLKKYNRAWKNPAHRRTQSQLGRPVSWHRRRLDPPVIPREGGVSSNTRKP